MIKIIILISILFFVISCVSKPPQPTHVIMKFESKIPIEITIYAHKNYEGNWNFCRYE
jgi:hypothetical protein